MTVSRAIDDLMRAFRRLPGVGPKTAQRYVFQLLARDREGALQIASTLKFAADNIQHCQQCNNFSETPICSICSSHKRDHSLLCVVEKPADLTTFEESGAYNGIYFVLMGRISPLDGIGPDELAVDQLLEYVARQQPSEIILATNSTVEGDATADYLTNLLSQYESTTTRLARGMPLGSELEYLDKGTLAEALQRRIPA